VGKKIEGCFGAYVAEVIFREENEYFSFMKNIPWAILGYNREEMMVLERDGSLG
jgi:hypothetical protein